MRVGIKQIATAACFLLHAESAIAACSPGEMAKTWYLSGPFFNEGFTCALNFAGSTKYTITGTCRRDSSVSASYTASGAFTVSSSCGITGSIRLRSPDETLAGALVAGQFESAGSGAKFYGQGILRLWKPNAGDNGFGGHVAFSMVR